MIRVTGPNDTRRAAPARKTGRSAAAFDPSIDDSANSGAVSNVDQTAPTAVMSALMSLQGEGGANAKTLVAAQRTLDALEELRLRVLDGNAEGGDIEALATAARARAHAAADPALQNIYDEIALRARVELAKLGR